MTTVVAEHSLSVHRSSRRLDGWPNLDLNVGAIIGLWKSPVVAPFLAEFAKWGPVSAQALEPAPWFSAAMRLVSLNCETYQRMYQMMTHGMGITRRHPSAATMLRHSISTPVA